MPTHARFQTRLTRFVLPVALGSAALLALAPSRPAATSAAAAAPRPHRFTAPLAFEQNDGQHDAAIRFAARGPGYAVAMLDTGVTLTLRGNGAPASRVLMNFGRADKPSPSAEAPMEGRANYFVGRDATDWRTNIPMFGRVRYKKAFDGIDLVFYGQDQQLEYDVVVAPGADPRAARIRFDGADALRVDRDGSLALSVDGRELRYSEPVAYQETSGTRTAVAARYRLDGAVVSFDVGAYDRAHPLVIDPVLRFSTYLGGSLSDFPTAVAVDAAGNTYVTGFTDSANFPVTPGVAQPLRSSPYADAFITKFSPAGAMIYSTYLGGSVSRAGFPPADHAYGIAVDGGGNAYVTGWTWSTDFPVTTGAFQSTARGDLDIFVTKLSPSGSRLVYSTYLGGSRQDWVSRGTIAVDMRGFAYVGGTTTSLDFPTTPGVIDSTNPSGDLTGFVVKLNQAGSGLVYGTYLTGSQQRVQGLAVEESGDVVATGSVLYSMQTSTGPSASLGEWDAFVFRLNPSATAFWARRVGGKAFDSGEAIAIGPDGMVYVAGSTKSPDLPVRRTGRQLAPGDTDAYFMRISPRFDWIFDAAYIGGNATDVARAISVDGYWKVTLVGSTWSTDLPVVRPIQARNAGGIDAFVTQFSFGNALSPSFATYLGGSDYDAAFGAALDGTGAVTLVGDTDSRDFPVAHAAQPANASGGARDGFVTRIAEAERGALGPTDVVVHVASAASLHGNWFAVEDAAAASGVRLHNPDAGAAKVTTPLANPSDYFEFTVGLQPRTLYRMWMRANAQGNSVFNDSVWVQFSNASNGSYEEDTFEELYRIGTTNAMAVTLEDCLHCLVRGWGWQDGGWGLNRLGPTFFVDSATTTVRVQRRDDGISIDQIVFVPAYEGSPSPYVQAAPGYQKDDTTILPVASPPGVDRDIVLYPGVDGARLHGAWRAAADVSAAGGARVWHPNAGAAKLAAPLESPVNYFELDFYAQTGVGYRIWIRGKADANHWANDSVFVQFSDSLTADGWPTWRMDTTSATTYVLEDCTGCSVSGWGWNDNEYGSARGPLVYFVNTGVHRIRVQTREDGLSIDQIVLSPRTYLDKAPGAATNDSTIVAR
jgi:hypothetical protein